MKDLKTFDFKNFIIALLSAMIVLLILTIPTEENLLEDNYLDYRFVAVPVQTKDFKPCAFEIWKIDDVEEDQFIRRVYFCEE